MINKNIKNEYFINVIVLENCPYSIKAEQILNHYKIKHDIIRVNHNNKYKYKNDSINTFPQIYLKKRNHNGNLLIGGYNHLKSLIETFKNNKYTDSTINEYINNNEYITQNNITIKLLLKLINLIN